MGSETKFSWEINDNKPKEWICPHCKKVNEDIRILCRECGNLRPSDILQTTSTSILEEAIVENEVQMENEIQVEEPIQEEDGFDIVYTVLVENRGTELVQAIKTIKDANGKGLKEVKDMLDDLPAAIFRTKEEELANNLCRELTDLGCVVKIQKTKEEKIEEVEEIEEESEKSSYNKNEYMIPMDIHSSSYNASEISIFPTIVMLLFLLVMLFGFVLLGISAVKTNEGQDDSSRDYAYTYAEETIIGFSWERCITVEEFSVVKESGNKLPENAKLLYEEQKIKNPEKEVLFKVGIEEDESAFIYKELPKEIISHFSIS